MSRLQIPSSALLPSPAAEPHSPYSFLAPPDVPVFPHHVLSPSSHLHASPAPGPAPVPVPGRASPASPCSLCSAHFRPTWDAAALPSPQKGVWSVSVDAGGGHTLSLMLDACRRPVRPLRFVRRRGGGYCDAGRPGTGGEWRGAAWGDKESKQPASMAAMDKKWKDPTIFPLLGRLRVLAFLFFGGVAEEKAAAFDLLTCLYLPDCPTGC